MHSFARLYLILGLVLLPGSDSLREPRSLAFPFNTNLRDNISSNRALGARQSQNLISDSDVLIDIGSVAAAGEVCIDKVVMVEETEFDDVIECRHSYTKRCHDTFSTTYSPQQEEECEENFKKNCFIEFKKRASKERIKVCNTPLVKNCDIQGPEECTTEYQTQCTTRYHEHEVQDDVPDCVDETEEKCEDVTQGYTTEQKCSRWPVKKCQLSSQTVKKYSPETTCRKVAFGLCGPAACPVEPGPEECIDKEETFIEEKPEEQCNLQPQKFCKLVTKLVPLLKAVENCIDVPKEVCSRSRRNPRRVKVPVIKKWCYTPKLESETDIKPDQFTTPAPPSCPSTCRNKARNRVCNPECNTPLCNFDGGDCTPPPSTTGRPTTTTPRTTRRTTTPRPTCPSTCRSKSRNRVCNPECNNPLCNYDGGDCDITTTTTTTTTTRSTTTTTPNIGYLPPYTG